MKSLNARWEAHTTAIEEMGDEAGKTFALRADGALVIFDEFGYFLIRDVGPGYPQGSRELVPNLLMLEAPDGFREHFYCEPIWIAGYFDHFVEMLHPIGG